MRAVDRIHRHGWEASINRIIIDAGKATLEFFGKLRTPPQHKSDASPVTAADLAAHREIISGLQRLAADVPIISEESFDGSETQAAQIIENRGTFWLVDPLDGTKEFIANREEYTINIALMENTRPIAGWVYLPVQGILYKAISGSGAFKINPGSAPTIIRTRRIPVETPVILISRSHRRGEAETLAKLMPQATVHQMGSSCKYTVIAEGAADLSVRRTPTKFWDTAAADAILTEAGGRIIGWDGHTLDYSRVYLTNPPFLAVGDRQLDVIKQFGILLGLE